MRFLFFVIIFSFGTVNAQTSMLAGEYVSTNLEQLQDGHLLVQLFENSRTKEHIKNELGEQAVVNYEAKLMKDRLNLMEAFKLNFTFSKVLFFYSSDRNTIKSKDFSSVTFYDFEHNIVPSDSIKIDFFLIGEKSRTEKDSIVYHKPNGETSKQPSYGFSAFIIRDHQFRQMQKPFPYFVRTMQGTPIFQRKSNALVKSLQSKLERKARKYKVLKK